MIRGKTENRQIERHAERGNERKPRLTFMRSFDSQTIEHAFHSSFCFSFSNTKAEVIMNGTLILSMGK